jgi:hypothetical protein
MVRPKDLQGDEAKLLDRYPQRLFSQALEDPNLWRILLDVWAELRGGLPLSAGSLTKDQLRAFLLPALETAFRNGEVVLIRHPAITMPGGVAAEAPAAAAEPLAPRASPRQQQRGPRRAWLEIVLRDEQNQPLPGARYRVTLPDGAVQEGVLDGNGSARWDDLDPGTCRVSFPDLDAKAWARA